MTSDNAPQSRWHIGKEIPIAVILAMLIQLGGFVYFMARLQTQGDDNTRRITVLESQKISERLAGLEVQISATNALLLRVDATTQRLIERTPAK